MLNELVKLANHLDGIGEIEISNKIDMIITKMSQDTQVDNLLDMPLGEVYAMHHNLVAHTDEEGRQFIELGGARSGIQPINMFDTPGKAMGDFDPSSSLRSQLGALNSARGANGTVRAFFNGLNRATNNAFDRMLETSSVTRQAEPTVTMDAGPVETLKDPNILRIEEIIGAPKTGSWKKLINGEGFRYLRRFLENNSNNIVAGLETSKLGPLTRGPDGRLRHEPLEQFEDPDKYVSKILSVGPKGFAVRGGSEVLNNSYSSWRKFIEELNDAANMVITASHGGEDYMSEFHAKSIEDSAEGIVEGLKEGKELDPWQKSYLAQADLMTNNVEKRLEVMAKQLDKLFKY